MIFSKKKKTSKLTIKYFLRKDISPITFAKYKVIDIYFHLYIEFIYKRKTNKCKSQFYKFVKKDYIPYNFIWNFDDSSFEGFNVHGVKEKVFNNELSDKINKGTDLVYEKDKEGLLNLLIFEKKHLQALFIGLEDIDNNSFTLSNLGEGYKNSIIFVNDIIDKIIKQLAIRSLKEIISFFPTPDTSTDWVNLTTNIILTVSRINLNKENENLDNKSQSEIRTKLVNYYLLLGKFKTFFDDYLVYNQVSGTRGITVPIWFSENHINSIVKTYKSNANQDLSEGFETFETIIKEVQAELELIWEEIKNNFK